jgi:hypothetical protein
MVTFLKSTNTPFPHLLSCSEPDFGTAPSWRSLCHRLGIVIGAQTVNHYAQRSFQPGNSGSNLATLIAKPEADFRLIDAENDPSNRRWIVDSDDFPIGDSKTDRFSRRRDHLHARGHGPFGLLARVVKLEFAQQKLRKPRMGAEEFIKRPNSSRAKICEVVNLQGHQP